MIAVRAHQVKSLPRIQFPYAKSRLDLMRRRDLSQSAKHIYSVLANHASMRGGDVSNLSNARIGAAVGLTASGVRRPLAALIAAGLVDPIYAAGGRVRLGIRVSIFSIEVSANAPTQAEALAHQRDGGSRICDNRVGAPAPTNTPEERKNLQTGGSFVSTFEGKENQNPADPKPSPSEIADAMRAMVAGKFAPAMFESKPAPCPEPSARIELDPSPEPADAQPAEPAPPTKAVNAPRTAPSAKPAVSPSRPTDAPQATTRATTKPAPARPATSSPSEADARNLAAARRYLADPGAGAKRVGFSAKVAAGYRRKEDRPNPGATMNTLAAWHRSQGRDPGAYRST